MMNTGRKGNRMKAKEMSRQLKKITESNENMLFVFFWVNPRRLIYICRRFGTLYLFHLQRQVLLISNLTHFFQCIYYFTSLHVSSTRCSSLGELNCINTASGIFHTMQVTAWYAGRKGTQYVQLRILKLGLVMDLRRMWDVFLRNLCNIK